jgi:redox-sensitive bicupin YhaK (pirin superfamily)
VFAYALSGTGKYGEEQREIGAQRMVIFNDDGDAVTLTAADDPLDLLLIGGVPLNEPIVRHGPFVMNTEDEIRQAIVDYQAGRMGEIVR